MISNPMYFLFVCLCVVFIFVFGKQAWALGCTKIKKKFSEFHSHLIYVVSIDIWKKTKIAKNNDFWGVFLSWLTFCRKCPFYALKRAQNSEFAYYASKSGKWRKRKPTPPLWGDVCVKKWSQSLDSGTRSTTFGHLKMGTFENAPKIIFLHFWSSFI